MDCTLSVLARRKDQLKVIEMNKLEQIYEYLGKASNDAIPTENFEFAILEIERLPNMAGHRAFYVLNTEKIYLMPDKFRVNSEAIHDLYDITSKYNDGNNHWNKAYFKLYPFDKFSIEFELDEELEN